MCFLLNILLSRVEPPPPPQIVCVHTPLGAPRTPGARVEVLGGINTTAIFNLQLAEI